MKLEANLLSKINIQVMEVIKELTITKIKGQVLEETLQRDT